ncbi:hypothetical protein, partial [uncultured Muribaculum sp.]
RDTGSVEVSGSSPLYSTKQSTITAATQEVAAVIIFIPYKNTYNIKGELSHIQNHWYHKESSMRDAVSFMFIRLIGQSLWLCLLSVGCSIHRFIKQS